MSTNCISETFLSYLDQASSLFEDENPVEAETMVQAIQECQSSSSANPISSVEHLSQTLKDKCSHIYKTIEPLIREELSRLGNEPSVSRKRMAEATPGSLTTEECQEYAQKKLKTQDAAQPTVQNKGEKKREIKNITDIMAQLQTDHYQGISLLQPFVPGFTPPPPGYSIPSDIDTAIEEQKSLLTAALKACRCALNVLPRSHAIRIIQNKSELARLLDVSHIRKVGATPHPETNVLLPLTETLSSRWPNPHNPPLLEVPGYLFLYPHAVDSKEGKNALTTNGARYFNTLNPWTTTLKYVEANVLQRPLSTYSAQELQDLLISLHNLLQEEEQPFRSQEMLVFPTAEEDPFGEYIECHKTTEPETCQRLIEIGELAARWGSF